MRKVQLSEHRLAPAYRAVFGVAFFAMVAMVLTLLISSVGAGPLRPPSTDEQPFTVQFANGARIPGIARQFTERFAAAGFTTADPLDTVDPVSRTVVYYRDGHRRAAQRVAAKLGKARVESADGAPTMNGASPSADVLVVLGADRASPTTSVG